jgi:hypothetical protein
MLGNGEIVIAMDLGRYGMMMKMCLWENLRMVTEKKEINTNWKKITLTHSIMSSMMIEEMKYQES